MVLDEKKRMIENIDTLLYSDITNPKSYLRWCRGFAPELATKKILESKGFQLMDTGWFFYYKNYNASGSTECTYCTISRNQITEEIRALYSYLAKYCDRLFFIHYENSEEFEPYDAKNSEGQKMTISIPNLKLKYFQFVDNDFITSSLSSIKENMDKKTVGIGKAKDDEGLLNSLEQFNLEELTDIYAQRYLVSHLLRDCKGYACDLDHVAILEEELIFVESKSKDPIGKNPTKKSKGSDDPDKWKFGWDWRRFAHYMELYYNSGIDTIYFIEELNNQYERQIIGHKALRLSQILRNSSWGVDANTNNIPYEAFEDM